MLVSFWKWNSDFLACISDMHSWVENKSRPLPGSSSRVIVWGKKGGILIRHLAQTCLQSQWVTLLTSMRSPTGPCQNQPQWFMQHQNNVTCDAVGGPGLSGAADGCNRFLLWKFLQLSERPLVLFWTQSPNMLNDTGFSGPGRWAATVKVVTWYPFLWKTWPACLCLNNLDGLLKEQVSFGLVGQICLPEAVVGVWICQIPQQLTKAVSLCLLLFQPVSGSRKSKHIDIMLLMDRELRKVMIFNIQVLRWWGRNF